MTLKLWLARLAMVLAGIATVVALTGATAQADPRPLGPQQAQALADAGTCPNGYWCAWEHIGYTGSSILYSSAWRGQCVSFTGFWSQRISSWQNYIGGDSSSFNLWGCPSYEGSHVWGWNGFTVGDARAWGFNDQTVSVYFYP